MNTPFEAGLGQFVKLDKGAGTTGSPAPFIGRAALRRQQDEGLTRTLVSLVVEGREAIAHGWEPVLDGETIIGYVTSGEYGHVVDQSLALAYVPLACGQPGTRLGIKILGERFGATVVKAPLYDPTNAKMKQ
jgi:dimethylglycine dehydrogenase